MMYKSITFDKRNAYWTNNRECNLMFLKQVENHIEDLLNNRGYVYLNQICEALGAGWDSYIHNPCFRRNEYIHDKIRFELKECADESYIVNIHCN